MCSSRRGLLVLLPLLPVLLAACGRKGDPIPPPRMIPAAPRNLEVQQRGDTLVFSMSYPSVTTGGLALPGVEAVELWRASVDAPSSGEVPPLRGAEFGALATQELVLAGEELAAAVSGPQVHFQIPMPLGPLADFPYGLAEEEKEDAAETGETGETEATGAGMPQEQTEETAPPTAEERDAAEEEPEAAGEAEPGETPAPSDMAVPRAHIFGVQVVGADGERSAFSNLPGLIPMEAPPPPEELALLPGADGVLLSWSSDYVFPPLPEPEEPEILAPEGETGEAADEGPEAGTEPGVEATESTGTGAPPGEEEAPEEPGEAPETCGAGAEGAEEAEGEPAEPREEGEEEAAGAEEERQEQEETAVAPPAVRDPRGFRVYRRPAESRHFGPPVATLPVDAEEYLDRQARFGEDYVYTVTTAISDRPVIESALPGEREIHYQDVYPPPPPRGVVALGEEGRIRILWDPSRAPDVAGYRVYRQGPGEEAFTPLMDEPTVRLEVADESVLPGRTYRYHVRAVDAVDNWGEPSQVVESRAR